MLVLMLFDDDLQWVSFKFIIVVILCDRDYNLDWVFF